MIQRLIVKDMGPYEGLLTFTRSTDLATLPAVEYRSVSPVEQIHRPSKMMPRFQLFRTKIQPSDSDQTIDVILKADLYEEHFDSLSHEAHVYESITPGPKGLPVPRFYGLFQAVIATDSRTGRKDFIYCLVLEYSGEPVEVAFDKMDRDDAWNVLLKLLAFHDAGFEHGKFFAHNILQTPDSAMTIIDLENATKHTCQRDRDTGVHEGAVAPLTWSDYGCKEVYEYALKSGIWFGHYIYFLGTPFYVSEIKSAEHLLSLVLHEPDILPSMNAMLLEEAQQIIDRLIAQDHPNYCPDPNWRP